ncbi:hypothetical protein KCU81_g5188, partial [Aureobasidium melanogenum]|uniref:Mitochondrial protein n=1 Tax=Aureobasidium melanogenum (strain CBS 110374) TaxID=1043003 RepID=A0A074VSL9_AURM1
MSKLSPALKQLINAPFARPGALPAPQGIKAVYQNLARDAKERGVGQPAWVSMATATTMTMNSPDSLVELFHVAAPENDSVQTAELMREVGLKCIGFNGVPRTINMLNAFRDSLPQEIISSLSTTPTRIPSPSNITAMSSRGEDLWKSIYDPFDKKLYDKLASSHPDLPVHILHSEYGALFADPEEKVAGKVGRVLTSIVAVSCLRTQTGVGPQVLSHVFGLRKAFKDGTAEKEVQGGEWLAGDEGSVWLLESVDRLVEALSGGKGSSYAPGLKAKL